MVVSAVRAVRAVGKTLSAASASLLGDEFNAATRESGKKGLPPLTAVTED